MAFLGTGGAVKTLRQAGRRSLAGLCVLAAGALGQAGRAAEPSAASAPATAAASAPAQPSSEYQLKAVFLFNFAQFAEWPARAFAEAKAPLVIGVLGEDPFGAYLDDVVKDERVGGRRIAVRRFARAEEVGECHILFISREESPRLEAIMPAFNGRSILTISDADNFTRAGGMVRFVTEGGKIRLRINIEAAKACGLTISSKIVRPATIVTPEKS